MGDTTVKIHRSTKDALDDLRSDRDTYDDIINKLISETKNKFLVKELVEAYQNKAEEDKKINDEWKNSSSGWN